ncbi:serine hydrolase [Paenibacillus lycopersici]|uniref:Serine hydrolase n=1 Tax=Paenibacillus lycopersici TaxID=2704462 RepID=A0A6C0G2B1_9BACL|nr:serine hydrolase [Paenibacillus lycopersici]QHT61369.1 serine hydrolase [Paenibacillus lycopersici]
MSIHVRDDLALPRGNPESQGVASSAFVAFLDEIAAKNLELHSFMVLRHDHVVAEGWWQPYAAELPHLLFSLSKSFTSTAIGFAVSEGLLTVDDAVISFFPDEAPAEPSANLRAMRIRHLLMMGTGHEQDTTDALWKQENGNWAEAFLSRPVDREPGSHFVYNSGATYMLSAILNKVTGQSLLDYLQPRLLTPLGIFGATWETCPRGIAVGGWGLSVTTESIAKFGQLYLRKGLWNGTRILSEAWIDEATTKHISNGDGGENDWAQGYGYQFWRCRHDVYRGDGAFGQYCIVMPDQDAVVAITAATNDMQAVLNAVWAHLLPAMTPAPLPADEEHAMKLAERIQRLDLPAPRQTASSSREDELSGRYGLEDNSLHWSTFGILFEEQEAAILLRDAQGEHEVRCGREAWIVQTAQNHGKEQRIAASFTWQDETSIAITVRYIETPFCHSIMCRLDGGQITLEIKANVNFGPSELMPPVKGSRIAADA